MAEGKYRLSTEMADEIAARLSLGVAKKDLGFGVVLEGLAVAAVVHYYYFCFVVVLWFEVRRFLVVAWWG